MESVEQALNLVRKHLPQPRELSRTVGRSLRLRGNREVLTYLSRRLELLLERADDSDLHPALSRQLALTEEDTAGAPSESTQ